MAAGNTAVTVHVATAEGERPLEEERLLLIQRLVDEERPLEVRQSQCLAADGGGVTGPAAAA